MGVSAACVAGRVTAATTSRSPSSSRLPKRASRRIPAFGPPLTRSTCSTAPIAETAWRAIGGRRHPGERAERLEPGGHVVDRVGVQRARSPVVTGVERRKQVAHLGAAALAEHEPVGSHPERLAQQSGEVDRARALEVRLPGLERNEVWMPHPQFRDILDRDDPLARRRATEQGREQRGLARPRGAGHEQVHPIAHERQHVGERDRRRRTRLARGPARVGGRGAGNRTETTVPIGDTGASAACTRMPSLSRVSTSGFASSTCRPPAATSRTARSRASDSVSTTSVRSRPAPAVDPRRSPAVDEHVGDPRVSDERA